eukprot:6174969-Pleurochrysis_carterae.AAC.3
MSLVAVHLAALLSAATAAHVFHWGDAVPMMKRIQYHQRRSGWFEVPRRIAPRFGINHVVDLDVLPSDYDGRDSYKMCAALARELCGYAWRVIFANGSPTADVCLILLRSFSLAGQQFITPWLSIADGHGNFLSRLQLTLVASGGLVYAARWSEEQVLEEPPDRVVLDVRWEHHLHEDLASGLGLLFVAGLAIMLVLLCIVFQQIELETDEPITPGSQGSGDSHSGYPNAGLPHQ